MTLADEVDLSIVIVNWNTRDLLAQCLRSIFAYPPNRNFEVVVVDNASTDGSVAMVRERFAEVMLIKNDSNPGFAVANNQAIRQSSGRHVLLLNPDTVVGPTTLQTLVAFMDVHPEAGAAGSMLVNPDGSLQASCSPSPTLLRELWRLFHMDSVYPMALYPMHSWPTQTPRRVETVQGASLIVRRQVIEQVGLLDESYFMYSEEVDWCERIRSDGWQIYWVPQSQVIHFGGQSTRQVAADMFIQLYQAKLLYFRKRYGPGYGIFYKGELFAAASARIMILPLAWLVQPERRTANATLAFRYGRLICSLPRM